MPWVLTLLFEQHNFFPLEGESEAEMKVKSDGGRKTKVSVMFSILSGNEALLSPLCGQP